MVSLIALMGAEILFWWLREYFNKLSITTKPPKKIEADSRNKDNQQFPNIRFKKIISLLPPIVLWYVPKTCDRTSPRIVIQANNTFLNKMH